MGSHQTQWKGQGLTGHWTAPHPPPRTSLSHSQPDPHQSRFVGVPRPSPTLCLISTHSRYSQHPTTRSLSYSDSLSQALPHTGTICRPRTVSHTTCHTRAHTQRHSCTHSQPHMITPSVTACQSHRLLTIKITATNSRAIMPGQQAGARDLLYPSQYEAGMSNPFYR